MKRKVFCSLLVLIALFVITACQNKSSDKLFALGRVDIVTSTGDDFFVSLKLLSSEAYENITVMTTDASQECRSTVSEGKKVYLEERNEEVYSYIIKLQFLQPAVMKKITLQLDETIADFEVGVVETVFLNQEATTASKNESEHLQVLQLLDLTIAKSYIKPAKITLKLNNRTLNVIKIKEIALATRPKEISIRLVKVLKQDPTLVSIDAKEYAYLYFENTCEDVLSSSCIVKIDYEYMGETFVKYATVDYGYTDALHASNILGSSISEKALIPGVIRAQNPN